MGLLAHPDAAVASHLDGFVFDFEQGAVAPDEWCTNVPPSGSCILDGDPVTQFGSSSWSGRFLGGFPGGFPGGTVVLRGRDYLGPVALSTHRAYLSFDLILRGDWGGNGLTPGIDGLDRESFFKVVANGQSLLDATFSTWSTQMYPGTSLQSSYPFSTGSVYSKPVPGSPYSEYVYHFDYGFDMTPLFPNCCTDMDIAFSARFGFLYQLPGMITGAWGLDNVVVSSTPVPEPATGALLGLGLLALGARRRRA